MKLLSSVEIAHRKTCPLWSSQAPLSTAITENRSTTTFLDSISLLEENNTDLRCKITNTLKEINFASDKCEQRDSTDFHETILVEEFFEDTFQHLINGNRRQLDVKEDNGGTKNFSVFALYKSQLKSRGEHVIRNWFLRFSFNKFKIVIQLRKYCSSGKFWTLISKKTKLL